ncbi:hypothetical protein [Micromonospora globbae]|uniref:hypothetical protein n=1 Tax=Micromonospora globbae TaxID=1894969 RepID=UPI00378FFB54
MPKLPQRDRLDQAKGREWEAVGVCLTGTEKAALASGLDPLNSNHRILYVALTRARSTIVDDHVRRQHPTPAMHDHREGHGSPRPTK